ncbi:MAG: HprK-related kinase B [Desulfobacterales bacterium]|nr:HprK-related kinase B [Desulfobacterales bacterium]
MNINPIDIKSLITEIRQEYSAQYTLYLSFGECHVSVSCNNQEIIKDLSLYYKPFLSTSNFSDIHITVHESEQININSTLKQNLPEPGKRKIKEEYIDIQDGRIVRKKLTGLVFIFGSGNHLCIGPCKINLNQVVNFINNRYIEFLLCKGCLLGHASGIALNKKGLAIAGFAGAGKSTMSLHLMSQGVSFVSNDRLMIEQQNGKLIMHGIAKLPRINPGTILNNPDLSTILDEESKKNFSKMSIEELWHLEEKYDVPIDECFKGSNFTLKAEMIGLVILNWKKGNMPFKINEVSLHERFDLLPAFMKSSGLFFYPSENSNIAVPNLENYSNLLSLCKVWEFSGGIDFDAATSVCLDLIKN